MGEILLNSDLTIRFYPGEKCDYDIKKQIMQFAQTLRGNPDVYMVTVDFAKYPTRSMQVYSYIECVERRLQEVLGKNAKIIIVPTGLALGVDSVTAAKLSIIRTHKFKRIHKNKEYAE